MPPNNTTSDSKLMDWLARRDLIGNPFAILNAEADPNLPHYYVDTILFDELLQLTQPCVIFGNRGSGKSAQRKMLAAQCRPLKPNSDYLAINYTYNEFEFVLNAIDDSINVIRDAHVRTILEFATKTFADELMKHEHLRNHILADSQIRLEVAGYLASYCPNHIARDFFSNSQSENVLKRRRNPDLLSKFVDLVWSINLNRCLILMDGLDEFPLSDSQILAFLKPLLGALPIIECPGLAFKFSFPQDWETLLRTQTWFRPDRLRIFHIEWTEEALQELISQRFAYFAKPGHPPYTQMAELCNEYLATRIDTELILLAKGSPRNVLLLADLIFRIHCRQTSPAERIAARTWEIAKVEWAKQQGATEASLEPMQSYVTVQSPSASSSTSPTWPLLRVEETGFVWLGEKQIRSKLSPKEYLVLLCLYNHRDGVCSRDIIAETAWPDAKTPGAITDEQISTQIRRLRQKLGQKQASAGYIETIRGDGYQLHLNGFNDKPDEESINR